MTCSVRACDPVIVDYLGIQLHCSCFKLISSFDLGLICNVFIWYSSCYSNYAFAIIWYAQYNEKQEEEKQSLAVSSWCVQPRSGTWAPRMKRENHSKSGQILPPTVVREGSTPDTLQTITEWVKSLIGPLQLKSAAWFSATKRQAVRRLGRPSKSQISSLGFWAVTGALFPVPVPLAVPVATSTEVKLYSYSF